MKLVIGIPTINRKDLLIPALLKYEAAYPAIDILIIDNGNQKIQTGNPMVQVLEQTRNLGVSASWNLICRKAFDEMGATHVMILNDDIELVVPKELLLKTIKSHGTHNLLVQDGTWCSFVLPKEVYKHVGSFDEQFYPAYYEDNDYNYRITLNPLTQVVVEPLLNPTLYRNSQTIALNPRLNERFLQNKARYVQKWGGEPLKEQFTTPYGN